MTAPSERWCDDSREWAETKAPNGAAVVWSLMYDDETEVPVVLVGMVRTATRDGWRFVLDDGLNPGSALLLPPEDLPRLETALLAKVTAEDREGLEIRRQVWRRWHWNRLAPWPRGPRPRRHRRPQPGAMAPGHPGVPPPLQHPPDSPLLELDSCRRQERCEERMQSLSIATSVRLGTRRRTRRAQASSRRCASRMTSELSLSRGECNAALTRSAESVLIMESVSANDEQHHARRDDHLVEI